jgi:dTDP-4-dehydrorhamnose 3,5-epimerase
VLSDTADLIYKATSYYKPETDRGIIWNDPQIGIEWPISKPKLSDKDVKLPTLAQADINYNYEKRES